MRVAGVGGSGFMGSGFRVQGTGYRVQGSRCRVQGATVGVDGREEVVRGRGGARDRRHAGWGVVCAREKCGQHAWVRSVGAST